MPKNGTPFQSLDNRNRVPGTRRHHCWENTCPPPPRDNTVPAAPRYRITRTRAKNSEIGHYILYHICPRIANSFSAGTMPCPTFPFLPHKKIPHTEVGMGIYLLFSSYNYRVDAYNIFIIRYFQIGSVVYANIRNGISDSDAYLEDSVHVFSI